MTTRQLNIFSTTYSLLKRGSLVLFLFFVISTQLQAQENACLHEINSLSDSNNPLESLSPLFDEPMSKNPDERFNDWRKDFSAKEIKEVSNLESRFREQLKKIQDRYEAELPEERESINHYVLTHPDFQSYLWELPGPHRDQLTWALEQNKNPTTRQGRIFSGSGDSPESTLWLFYRNGILFKMDVDRNLYPLIKDERPNVQRMAKAITKIYQESFHLSSQEKMEQLSPVLDRLGDETLTKKISEVIEMGLHPHQLPRVILEDLRRVVHSDNVPYSVNGLGFVLLTKAAEVEKYKKSFEADPTSLLTSTGKLHLDLIIQNQWAPPAIMEALIKSQKTPQELKIKMFKILTKMEELDQTFLQIHDQIRISTPERRAKLLQQFVSPAYPNPYVQALIASGFSQDIEPQALRELYQKAIVYSEFMLLRFESDLKEIQSRRGPFVGLNNPPDKEIQALFKTNLERLKKSIGKIEGAPPNGFFAQQLYNHLDTINSQYWNTEARFQIQQMAEIIEAAKSELTGETDYDKIRATREEVLDLLAQAAPKGWGFITEEILNEETGERIKKLRLDQMPPSFASTINSAIDSQLEILNVAYRSKEHFLKNEIFRQWDARIEAEAEIMRHPHQLKKQATLTEQEFDGAWQVGKKQAARKRLGQILLDEPELGFEGIHELGFDHLLSDLELAEVIHQSLGVALQEEMQTLAGSDASILDLYTKTYAYNYEWETNSILRRVGTHRDDYKKALDRFEERVARLKVRLQILAEKYPALFINLLPDTPHPKKKPSKAQIQTFIQEKMIKFEKMRKSRLLQALYERRTLFISSLEEGKEDRKFFFTPEDRRSLMSQRWVQETWDEEDRKTLSTEFENAEKEREASVRESNFRAEVKEDAEHLADEWWASRKKLLESDGEASIALKIPEINFDFNNIEKMGEFLFTNPNNDPQLRYDIERYYRTIILKTWMREIAATVDPDKEKTNFLNDLSIQANWHFQKSFEERVAEHIRSYVEAHSDESSLTLAQHFVRAGMADRVTPELIEEYQEANTMRVNSETSKKSILELHQYIDETLNPIEAREAALELIDLMTAEGWDKLPLLERNLAKSSILRDFVNDLDKLDSFSDQEWKALRTKLKEEVKEQRTVLLAHAKEVLQDIKPKNTEAVFAQINQQMEARIRSKRAETWIRYGMVLDRQPEDADSPDKVFKPVYTLTRNELMSELVKRGVLQLQDGHYTSELPQINFQGASSYYWNQLGFARGSSIIMERQDYYIRESKISARLIAHEHPKIGNNKLLSDRQLNQEFNRRKNFWNENSKIMNRNRERMAQFEKDFPEMHFLSEGEKGERRQIKDHIEHTQELLYNGIKETLVQSHRENLAQAKGDSWWEIPLKGLRTIVVGIAESITYAGMAIAYDTTTVLGFDNAADSIAGGINNTRSYIHYNWGGSLLGSDHEFMKMSDWDLFWKSTEVSTNVVLNILAPGAGSAATKTSASAGKNLFARSLARSKDFVTKGLDGGINLRPGFFAQGQLIGWGLQQVGSVPKYIIMSDSGLGDLEYQNMIEENPNGALAWSERGSKTLQSAAGIYLLTRGSGSFKNARSALYHATKFNLIMAGLGTTGAEMIQSQEDPDYKFSGSRFADNLLTGVSGSYLFMGGIGQIRNYLIARYTPRMGLAQAQRLANFTTASIDWKEGLVDFRDSSIGLGQSTASGNFVTIGGNFFMWDAARRDIGDIGRIQDGIKRNAEAD